MSEHYINVNEGAVSMKRATKLTAFTTAPMVRVYKSSPYSVCMQIRGKSGFSSVNLPLKEALDVAMALKIEAANIEEEKRKKGA